MTKTINNLNRFSDSLLSIVKGKALYSGDSKQAFEEITKAASTTLDVERASIWMYNSARNGIRSVDLYERQTDSHSDGLVLLQVDFPSYFDALSEDRVIDANDAHTDPRTSEFSASYLTPVGITSMLDAPIRFGGKTVGVICLEHIGPARHWQADEMTYAASLADMVSHAVEAEKRARAEAALSESENRYKTLIENMPDILYQADAEGTITYISPAITPITGFTVEEALGMDLASDMHAEASNRDIFLSEIQKTGVIRDFECEYKRKDGTTWWASVNAQLLKDEAGNILGVDGIVRDISEQKSTKDKLSYQATHDILTGLINRREFENRVGRLLQGARERRESHAMCFMDLDQFKVVNDTCGHVAGDELLRQLGKLLNKTVSKRDTLARLGGDEFGVLLEFCSLEHAHRLADAILKTVMDFQFHWEDKTFRIGVSIGLVAITETSGSFTELFRQADAACYLAKDLGRNRIHAYHPDDTEMAVRHGEMQWVGRISKALDEDRFCIYSQPIISLGDGNHKHYELLIRMIDERGETVPPGAFLPAAERYSLIEKLDTWMVNHALDLLASHPIFFKDVDFITINLSGPSLTNKGFLDFILNKFEETAISPRLVCFEITETVAITNLESAISFMNTLKKSGFRFALDDFGSGLSSFGYLKNLPVDFLKIDGMFVRDIVDDPIDHAMVKSINEIGQVMGMQTIAEFVENEEIQLLLSDIGVDFGQGYGLGRPVPLEEIIEQSEAKRAATG